MTIRFLGQSGYLLKTDRTAILIDPYLSDSVNRAAGRPRALPIPLDPASLSCDAVICTHDHLDHLDPDTVIQLPDDQFYITTREGKAHLEKLGRTNALALSVGDGTAVGDFEIRAVYARHTAEAFGVIVKAEDKTLYFSGDTLFDTRLFDVKKYRPDVGFYCINGRLGNMNVREALTAAKEIGAKVNVPNHYDMFASNSEDPALFADHIEGSFVMEFNREYGIGQIISQSHDR